MTKTERQSNFELLRCILMIFVVIVHYNNADMGGALRYVVPSGPNYYFLYFIESIAIISVNGFVLLAGYFGYQKTSVSLRKPIGLLLYVIAYNYLFYFVDILMGIEPFSLKLLVYYAIPQNWYVILYITLLLISPYINIVINRLNKKNTLILLAVLGTLFSVWSTLLDVGMDFLHMNLQGISTVSLSGTQAGYSIVNFVLLYCIGAAIHKWNLLDWKKGKDALLFLLMVLLIFVTSLFSTAVWTYSSIFVILSSGFLFNYFRKITIRSRIINKFAGATLGVYLISCKLVVIKWFWGFFKIPEYAAGNVFLFAANMLVCVLVTFFACAIIDMFCRWATKFVSALLDKLSILSKKIIEIDLS